MASGFSIFQASALPVACALLAVGRLEARDPTFEQDVRPILKAHCFLCHGEGERLKGGVDLRLRRFMEKPTEDGTRIMVPGRPEESEMVSLVRGGEMPKKGKLLTPAEIAVIEQWIAQGAKTVREEPAEVPKFWISEEDRQFWAFRPIARPEPPVDTTLVHWGGEMGRLPVLQNDVGREKCGRDHNTFGFSMWLAGGGIKAGCVHGETDEWGQHAVKDIVHHYDYHATLLHLFGLDHEKLTYKRNGAELSLTDKQGARLVAKLLA